MGYMIPEVAQTCPSKGTRAQSKPLYFSRAGRWTQPSSTPELVLPHLSHLAGKHDTT